MCDYSHIATLLVSYVQPLLHFFATVTNFGTTIFWTGERSEGEESHKLRNTGTLSEATERGGGEQTRTLSCAVVMDPTVLAWPVPVPLATPEAFLRSSEAGGVFRTKVKLLSWDQ
jgi:hypothetical protein